MKVAIVYDRVNKWGGAERVLLALHKIYPKAPLFTSVYDPKKASWAKAFPKVYTSFLQNLPLAKGNHEFLAPLMPIAFSQFDFSDFDVVISVTSEFAKNIKIYGKTVHICYCLTPTRYLWSGYDDYFSNPLLRIAAKPLTEALKIIDKRAAHRPHLFVAISTEVKKRIKKYYNRKSVIVYPPVDIRPGMHKTEDYYLIVSRLDFGYKKVDLAIRTFNKMDKKLVVVGTGRQVEKLKQLAHKNIKFVGKVDDKKLAKLYKGARALIMPQIEDFGIVAVEAQGYGVPVIAYKKGGSLDTVIDRKTGVFFDRQNEQSLIKAILMFEMMRFKGDNLLTNAKKFSFENFKGKFVKIVEHELRRRGI